MQEAYKGVGRYTEQSTGVQLWCPPVPPAYTCGMAGSSRGGSGTLAPSSTTPVPAWHAHTYGCDTGWLSTLPTSPCILSCHVSIYLATARPVVPPAVLAQDRCFHITKPGASSSHHLPITYSM